MEVTVTEKALEREKVMQKIAKGQMTQSEGAEGLGLCRETVNRLMQKYVKDGICGLVSKRVGKTSGNAYADTFKSEVEEIVSAGKFAGFGPTLMSETLGKRFAIRLSKETLRKWMSKWGLWKIKRKREKRIHVRRERRACRGELVQIDGSRHDWFEGRAAKCCLIVFIDDASGNIMAHFAPSETAGAYMDCLRKYISGYGLPATLYHDRHGIFTINTAIDHLQRAQYTQFGRVMHQLDYYLDQCAFTAGERTGRAGKQHFAGSLGKGDAFREDQQHRESKCFSSVFSCRLQ